MPKEIFFGRNRITLQAAWTVQKQPSTAIHFRIFLQKILEVERFFWSFYRLTVQSSNYILKWLYLECFLRDLPLGLFRSSCPQPFENFCQKILVVESFFWSNYRLAVQSSDYILKWLHQEYFVGDLPKAFGGPKCHRL